MQTVNAVQVKKIIELRRDDCPVIFSNPGNPEAFARAFKKMRKIVEKMPLQPDPAKDLKKTRERRGLV